MDYHKLVESIAEEFDVDFNQIMSVTVDPFSVYFELKSGTKDYKGLELTYTQRYMHDRGIHND